MTRMTKTALPAALLFTLFGSACSSSPTGGGDDDGNGGLANNIVNPVVFEAFLENVGYDAVNGMIDALKRLVTATNGGGFDGVVIVPTGGDSFRAEVSADLDGDGTRESTIFGNSSGDIGTGASISITSVTFPEIPSLMATASFVATSTSPSEVSFDGIAGTISMDEPGSQNAADVVTTGGAVVVDLDSGIPTGFSDNVISGEGQQLSVRVYCEPVDSPEVDDPVWVFRLSVESS